MNIVYFEGVKATVPRFNFKFLSVAFLIAATLVLSGCPSTDTTNPGSTEAAAKVNGKTITMEAVEKAVKGQLQGQEAKISQLELANVRLQALQQLIQQEVMYQKAEAEKTIPSEEEITQEFNKAKTASGQSAEQIEKQMKDAGETEASIREGIKKQLAITKLVEKISSKVDAPKDSEIEAFFKGNPEAFVKKKGVKLAAIVVDPRDNGEGDTTKNESDAALKIKEIGTQLNQGVDFASVAREKSEDQSRAQGGDLGYFSEEELKQNYPQLAAGFMSPQFPVGKIAGPFNLEGRFYIFKLQERSDKDENVTLESPGIRQQIADALTNNRKQLLAASYQTMAINEAKVENYLAKKVVDNPNDLSGARPAPVNTPTPANTNTAANPNVSANTVATNSNTNSAVRPAVSPAAANTAANRTANK